MTSNQQLHRPSEEMKSKILLPLSDKRPPNRSAQLSKKSRPRVAPNEPRTAHFPQAQMKWREFPVCTSWSDSPPGDIECRQPVDHSTRAQSFQTASSGLARRFWTPNSLKLGRLAPARERVPPSSRERRELGWPLGPREGEAPSWGGPATSTDFWAGLAKIVTKCNFLRPTHSEAKKIPKHRSSEQRKVYCRRTATEA